MPTSITIQVPDYGTSEHFPISFETLEHTPHVPFFTGEVPVGGSLFFRFGSVSPLVRGVGTNDPLTPGPESNGDVQMTALVGVPGYLTVDGPEDGQDDIVFNSNHQVLRVDDNKDFSGGQRHFSLFTVPVQTMG